MMEEEMAAEGLLAGQGMMQATEAPSERGVQQAYNNCAWMFHIPLSGPVCSPPAPLARSASQEDLDHLKAFLAGNGEVLSALRQETQREAGGRSRFQDVISEALPEVREANEAFYETLEKFLRDLEEHAQAHHPPHEEDEKKKQKGRAEKSVLLPVTGRLAQEVEEGIVLEGSTHDWLKEHLRMMDHMLRVTGRLAEEVEHVSQKLLGTLNPEKATTLAYGSPLASS